MTRTRRTLLLVVILGFILGSIGAVVYVKKTNKKGSTNPSITQQLNTSSISQKLLTWEDPAGFKFQYPDGLTTDKHDEDIENYAHIEFTHPENPGNVIIWAKDTTAKNIEAWLTSQPEFSSASVIDTTLGGEPAKKILLNSPKRIIVAALDNDVIVTVEALLTTPFWSGVQDAIIANFAFTPPQDETSGGAASQDYAGESFNEEEILE